MGRTTIIDFVDIISAARLYPDWLPQDDFPEWRRNLVMEVILKAITGPGPMAEYREVVA